MSKQNLYMFMVTGIVKLIKINMDPPSLQLIKNVLLLFLVLLMQKHA